MLTVAITRDEDNNGRHGTRARCLPSPAPFGPPSPCYCRGGDSFRSVCGRLPLTQPFAPVKVNCAATHARRNARANWRASRAQPSGTRRVAAKRCVHGASSILLFAALYDSFRIVRPFLPAISHRVASRCTFYNFLHCEMWMDRACVRDLELLEVRERRNEKE